MLIYIAGRGTLCLEEIAGNAYASRRLFSYYRIIAPIEWGTVLRAFIAVIKTKEK